MLKKPYIMFYLEGREADSLQHSIDEADLAELVIDGKGMPYEVALAAAQKVASEHASGVRKTKWIGQSRPEIKEAGGDADEAYRHYLLGRTDALALDLESEVVELMNDDDEVELTDEDDDKDPPTH